MTVTSTLASTPLASTPRASTPLVDLHGRPLGDLRLSVTDRCNLRCTYCMPEENYRWLPRRDLLTFEEVARVVDAFVAAGVSKVRLTGGEPLLRKDLHQLVAMIAERDGVRDFAMTTNGVLLQENLGKLKAAGLRRCTISLDTLKEDRFRRLAKRDNLQTVIDAIRAVPAAGFEDTKIDTVVMRGFNDDELVDLLAFARTVGAELRFIEYMDVGGATHWSMSKVFSRADILATLAAHYGAIQPVGREARADTAARFKLPDGTVFGIVSSTTQPFCSACNRSRLTADGTWYLCLYAESGIDLRTPLRGGISHEGLVQLLRDTWIQRRDRGAEERRVVTERGPSVDLITLRKNPRLEMHTRGG